MEVVSTEAPLVLKVLALGLKTTLIVVLFLAAVLTLFALFWKSSIIQILVQSVAKLIPSASFLNLQNLRRVQVSPKVDTEHCSICYSDIEREVKANCGHVFCGGCLIQFWESKKKERIACPLCRCDVNLIIPNFNHHVICSKDEKTKEIVENITRYNISCSTCPTTILNLILGSPASIRIFLESLPSRKGFGSILKGCLGFLYGLAMLLYMVSPQDKIQEYDTYGTMFGWIDDSASFIYLFLYVILLFIMVV